MANDRPTANPRIEIDTVHETLLLDDGGEKTTDQLSDACSFNSINVSESITLPSLTFKRKRPRSKARLPGALKLPKSYQPRYLSPMEEQMLASRLSKAPDRWSETYSEDIGASQKFATKKLSKKDVDRIVARLSATSRHEEPATSIHEEDLLGFEEETKEEDGVRKLDQKEVDKLVERLSCTSLRSDAKSAGANEQFRSRLTLTARELETLTARLSRPRNQTHPPVAQKGNGGRFIGRKMTDEEINGMVHRIACKGMKPRQSNQRLRKHSLGYFAVWTPCDSDFKTWRIMNGEQQQQRSGGFYQYY